MTHARATRRNLPHHEAHVHTTQYELGDGLVYFENAAQRVLVPLDQLDIATPAQAVGGYLVPGKPAAAGVLIEVLAGVGCAIERRRVEADVAERNAFLREA